MIVDQSAFAGAIFDPSADVPEGLVDPAGRRAGKRFDVYRNNVIVSLSKALAEAFPVLARLLGSERFPALAGHYVRAHPPTDPRMMYYGEAMPGFLAGFEPLKQLQYLPDTARLEIAVRAAYHAADASPIEASALASVAPDRLATLRLRLAPAVRLVRSDWPIVAIRAFNLSNGPKPAMRAESALVTRPGFDPQVAALDPAAADFVAALAEGQTLGEAVAERPEGFDPSGALGVLLAGSAITELHED